MEKTQNADGRSGFKQIQPEDQKNKTKNNASMNKIMKKYTL